MDLYLEFLPWPYTSTYLFLPFSFFLDFRSRAGVPVLFLWLWCNAWENNLKRITYFVFVFRDFCPQSVWYLTLGLGWGWIAGMWRRKLFIFKQTGMRRGNACFLLTPLSALLLFHISPQPIGRCFFPPCIPSRPTLLNRSWKHLRDVPSGEGWALLRS